MKLKIINIFIIIFLILISINNIYSEELLANIDFEVLDDGTIKIEGTSNYNDFNKDYTYDYITKEDRYWLIDINTPVFENFYYSLTLPKDSKINYIKSTNNVNITNINNKLKVTAFGNNQPINLKIQYVKEITNNNSFNYFMFLYFFVFFLVFYLVIIYYKKNLKTKENNKMYKFLTKREQNIINIIKKEKTTTQKFIQNKLNLPKSSLSRNLQSLKDKDLIEIHKFGMTNKISLKSKK